MTRLLSVAGLVALGLSTGAAQPIAGQRPPAVPYEDKGLCPFECCTYREWTVEADTLVRVKRNDKSPVLYRLKRGDTAHGLTGVVVTTRLGRAKVNEPTTLGGKDIPVIPGDLVYLINYVGEGYWKFWVNGETDQEQIADIGQQCVDGGPVGDLPVDNPTGCIVQITSRPRTIWWAQVKNKAGQVGWTRDLDNFGNIDACG